MIEKPLHCSLCGATPPPGEFAEHLEREHGGLMRVMRVFSMPEELVRPPIKTSSLRGASVIVHDEYPTEP